MRPFDPTSLQLVAAAEFLSRQGHYSSLWMLRLLLQLVQFCQEQKKRRPNDKEQIWRVKGFSPMSGSFQTNRLYERVAALVFNLLWLWHGMTEDLVMKEGFVCSYEEIEEEDIPYMKDLRTYVVGIPAYDPQLNQTFKQELAIRIKQLFGAVGIPLHENKSGQLQICDLTNSLHNLQMLIGKDEMTQFKECIVPELWEPLQHRWKERLFMDDAVVFFVSLINSCMTDIDVNPSQTKGS